jgi:hypothetical protein
MSKSKKVEKFEEDENVEVLENPNQDELAEEENCLFDEGLEIARNSSGVRKQRELKYKFHLMNVGQSYFLAKGSCKNPEASLRMAGAKAVKFTAEKTGEFKISKRTGKEVEILTPTMKFKVGLSGSEGLDEYRQPKGVVGFRIIRVE